MNINEPKIEPWGIPCLILEILDEIMLTITC